MRMMINKRRIIGTIAVAVISVAAMIPSNTVSAFCAEKTQEIAAVDVESAISVRTRTKKVTGTYHQTEARKMFKKINKFRTSKNAWYSGINGEKVNLPNLKRLEYDYLLEKAAMARAAEISQSFDHTRPNGIPVTTILYDDYGYEPQGNWVAENLSTAAANDTPKAVVKRLREDGLSYSEQGHRRNMLEERVVSCGCACFETNGRKYWVQLFGLKCYDTNKTAPNNSENTVNIAIK